MTSKTKYTVKVVRSEQRHRSDASIAGDDNTYSILQVFKSSTESRLKNPNLLGKKNEKAVMPALFGSAPKYRS